MTTPVHIMMVVYRQCGAVKVYVPNDRGHLDEFTITFPVDLPEVSEDLMILAISNAVGRQINSWRPDLKGEDIAIEPFIADDCDDVPEKAYEGCGGIGQA
jgi:hypothetical protein